MKKVVCCQLCQSEENLVKDRDIGTVCKKCNDNIIKNVQDLLFGCNLREMKHGEYKDRLAQVKGMNDEWWENS